MKIKATMVASTLLLALSGAASAQTSPVGRWKTLDDETGKAMSVTEVYQAKNGTYAAKIVETLSPPNALCTKCSGKNKNKPITGMMVFWNVKASGSNYGGGEGFKPSSGDNFKVKSVKVVDGGKKLEITGCKMSFLCRTATWVRAD